MPTTRINGVPVQFTDNFPPMDFSRREQKGRGLPDDVVDTDDERAIVAGTDAKRRQMNLEYLQAQGLSPRSREISEDLLPGTIEYGRLQRQFGSGVGTFGADMNTQETALLAIRRLSTALVKPNQVRTMHRGGSIKADEKEALMRVLEHGDEEDIYTVSHIMLHGYTKVDGTRSKDRSPSVSSDHRIAEEYARRRRAPGTRELRFFLTVKGETTDHRAALGASCALRVNAAGGKRELILDDRNTYFTTRVKTERDRITLHIEVTGQSTMGDRARARAQDPYDRASISPQAFEAGRAAQSAREQRANEKTSEDAEFTAGEYARERSMPDVE